MEILIWLLIGYLFNRPCKKHRLSNNADSMSFNDLVCMDMIFDDMD